MFSTRTCLKSLAATVLLLGCCGQALAQQSGDVFSISQKHEVLNKIGTFKVVNQVGRLFLSGSNQFLEVDLNLPVSNQNNVSVFRYRCTETHGQINNPSIWEIVSIGELTLDGNSAHGRSMDGTIRQTDVILNYSFMSKKLPQAQPPQLVRFVQ